MSLSAGLAIFFVLWWLVLFVALPWGIRSQEESGEVVRGSDPGAPAIPALVRKLLWTTIVASVVFVLLDVIYSYRLVSLEDMTTLWGLLK